MILKQNTVFYNKHIPSMLISQDKHTQTTVVMLHKKRQRHKGKDKKALS